MRRPEPKNVESQFNIDEMFFSKTDLKGIILDGNEVFYRVSKYPPEEMIGKPHNLVRHPDMPKVVFKLLWDYIKKDKPFAGYVKNLAKDGSYYWVYAVAVPVIDENGEKNKYLSIRIKPTSHFFTVVKNLYEKILKVEKTEGVESSEKELFENLKAMGYESYDDFMIDTLMEELKGKDEYLDKDIDLTKLDGDLEIFKEVYMKNKRIKNMFDVVAKTASNFINVEKELESKFSYIYEITDELSLIALNSSVESYKLGSTGASFFVVSSEIKKDSERIGKLVVGLRDDIQKLLKIVREILLYTNISKLSIYMTNYFIGEILKSSECDSLEKQRENLEDLVSVVFYNIRKNSNFVKDLINYLKRTEKYIDEVEGIIRELHYIQLNGLVESARLGEQKFSIIFNQVKELVENTTNIINEIKPMIINTIKESEEINSASEKIFKELSQMQKLIKSEELKVC